MSMSGKATANCSRCGTASEVEVWSGINVGEHPELRSRVKDGSLFVWECPGCGTANLARYQTLYHDPESRTMVWLLPPGIIDEAQVEALGRQVGQSSDLPEGYTLRRVEEVGELVEKVNVLDAGLDDRAIEVCKYITKMEMMEKGESKDLLDAPFKYCKADGADIDILFSFPFEGEMRAVRVGLNVYEDCLGIISRNPNLKPEPGFAKIDSSWVSKVFR